MSDGQDKEHEAGPLVPGLTFYSMVGTGYGCASLEYLRALEESNVPVQWRWLYWAGSEYRENEESGDPANLEMALKEYGKDTDDYRDLGRLCTSSCRPRTEIYHTVPEIWPRYRSSRQSRVGMTVWETDRLPGHWKPLLNEMDEIIVPGEFSRRTIEGSGITTPTSCIPHVYRPIDSYSRISGSAFRKKYGIPGHHFMFYSIDEWTPRKRIWDTVSAYLLAYTRRDPVTLVLKTSTTGVVSPRSRSRLPVKRIVEGISANFENCAGIVVIDGKIPEADIAGLHLAGDAYVSLTSGEGWGLSAFNAAASGNPVIITGWGGQLDYLGADYPYLLEYSMRPVVDKAGEPSYASDQLWARADIDHAIERMREVFRNPGISRTRVATLAASIPVTYSGARIAGMFRRFV